MQEELQKLVSEAQSEITNASDLKALDDVRVKYLGKKGSITGMMKELGKLSPEERPKAGQVINVAKQDIQQAIEARKTDLQNEALNAKLSGETIDVTLPGRRNDFGGFAFMAPDMQFVFVPAGRGRLAGCFYRINPAHRIIRAQRSQNRQIAKCKSGHKIRGTGHEKEHSICRYRLSGPCYRRGYDGGSGGGDYRRANRSEQSRHRPDHHSGRHFSAGTCDLCRSRNKR